MSLRAIVNIALALVIVGVVAAVGYLEWSEGRGNDTPASTTSASTSTSTSSTSTTTSSTSTTSTSSTTTTTTIAPTTTTTIAPPPQAFIPVVVVNPSTVGERVGLVLYRLVEVGYTDVRGLNGTVPKFDTVIYYQPDFQSSAERLAVELGLPVTAIAPIAQAPPVAGLDNALLMVYLGGA